MVFVTHRNAKRHFRICPYLSMAKVPISLSLFLLDAFHHCFFSKIEWFLVCQTTFKGFYEILLKKGNACATRTRCILLNDGPIQVWKKKKKKKTEPNFQHVIMWNATKNQDRPPFRTYMMYMYSSKLYNLFGEAFLFDVSTFIKQS